jgi:hypothetical protein
MGMREIRAGLGIFSVEMAGERKRREEDRRNATGSRKNVHRVKQTNAKFTTLTIIGKVFHYEQPVTASPRYVCVQKYRVQTM